MHILAPTGSPFIDLVIILIVLGIVVTVLLYLVDTSPMAEPFKGWVRWGIIALAVLSALKLFLAAAGVAI